MKIKINYCEKCSYGRFDINYIESILNEYDIQLEKDCLKYYYHNIRHPFNIFDSRTNQYIMTNKYEYKDESFYEIHIISFNILDKIFDHFKIDKSNNLINNLLEDYYKLLGIL